MTIEELIKKNNLRQCINPWIAGTLMTLREKKTLYTESGGKYQFKPGDDLIYIGCRRYESNKPNGSSLYRVFTSSGIEYLIEDDNKFLIDAFDNLWYEMKLESMI